MNLRIDVDEKKVIKKVTNDKFGLFASSEWKRLIDPYTPRDTGTMQGSARIKPWEIHYNANYSEYVYYKKNAVFKKKNPYATSEWDVAAEKAGQKSKLYRTLNNALQSGRF